MKPKIKSLHYKVMAYKSVDYDNAKEIREETDDFILIMNHKNAVFEMKDHFISVGDARAIIDDFLDRWQVLIGLENNPDELTFQYETAEFEQTQGDEKSHGFISVHSATHALVSDKVELHVSQNVFPNRPHHFKLSPDVITMYQRYKLYRQGKENLTSMTFMCLTVLEASARTHAGYNKNTTLRRKASHRYNIKFDVLRKIGRLSSKKGNEIEARKAPNNGLYEPLKPEEKDWLIRAIKAIIKRAGEYAYDPTAQHSLITMEQI